MGAAFIALAFICIGLFAYSANNTVNAAAGINHQINFQGKLVNPSDGTNVTDGNYTVVFSIYSVASAGSAIWTETQTVTVSSGIFQVNLGSVTTLPGSVDFNTDNIYLGIKVGSDAEMTPRIQFTAVPQAFNSEKLNGLTSSQFAQLATNQTFTGTNTFQPTTNITSVKILQNSSGSFGQDIFNVQGSSGGANNFIQVTSTAANQGAVTIASLGSNNLNLNSGSNIVSVGATNITGTGALTVDSASASALSLGTANANAVAISKTGVTTTINGALGVTQGTTLTGTLTLNNTGYINTNSTTALKVENSTGNTNVLVVDTTNGRVGINKASPNVGLDVGGSAASGTIGTQTLFQLTRPVNGSVSYPQVASFNLGSYAVNGAGNGYGPSTRLDINLKSTSTNTEIADTNVLTLQSNGQVGINGTPVNGNGILTVGTNTTAASGGIYLGADTNLYRNAPNSLMTDGSLQINGIAGIGQFQNYIANSETIGGTGWANAGSYAPVINSTTAPDGNTTATKLLQNGTTSGSFTQQSITLSSSASPYTASVWAKSGNVSQVLFGIYDYTTSGWLNYQAFTTTANWQRFSVTGTPVAAGHNIVMIIFENSAADVTPGDYIYVWGAQAVDGSAPLIYNRTYGTPLSSLQDGVVSNGSVYQTASNANNYIAGTTTFTGSGNGSNVAGVLLQNAVNSTTAFQIQNAAGSELFTVDTSNNKLGTQNQSSASTNSVGINLQTGNATGATSNSGSLTIDTGSATGTAGNLSIGTGGYTHNTTIGNTSGTSSLTLQGGTGGINLTPATTGNILIGNSAGTGNITLGSSSATQSVFIGSGTGTSNVYLGSNATSGTIAIGTSFFGGTTSIGATGGATTTNIYAGTGNILLQPSGASNTGVVVKPAGNSTTAFQIQNAAGSAMLTQNTTTGQLTVSQGGLAVNGITNPAAPSLSSSGSGGTLAAATYYYLLAATGPAGETAATVSSPASVTTSGTTSKNTLTWSAVTNATGYKLYRSTDNTNWKVNTLGAVTTAVDDGTNFTWGTTGSPSMFSNNTGNITLTQGAALSLDQTGTHAVLFETPSGIVLGDYGGTGGVAVQAYSFSFQDNTGFASDFSINNTGATTFQNRVNSTTAFQIQNAAGTSNLFVADTSNGRVGIGTAGPTAKLQVSGGGGATVDLLVNGRIATGDGGLNGGVWLNSAQTQFVGQMSATQLGFYNGGWAYSLDNTGKSFFQNSVDSTSAFGILNAIGTNYFGVDTTNGRVGVGAGAANSVLTVGTNTTTASGGLIFGTDTSANLYRSAAGTIKTDGALSVAGSGLFGGQIQANGLIYSSLTGNTSFALNSTGANFGLIENTAANTWALGYGISNTALGTAALTWNSSGNVTVANNLTTNGSALIQDGVSNGTALSIVQSNATDSNGLSIRTGTTLHGDTALDIKSNAGSNSIFSLRNDGQLGLGVLSPTATLDVRGNQLIRTGSTTAFQIQDASINNLLTADTTNLRLSVGSGGTATGQLYIPGTLPAAALSTASVGGSGQAHDVAVNGRYMYTINFNTTTLYVFDVQNPGSPVQVASLATLGGSPEALAFSGHYVYIAEYSTGGGNKMEVVDVSKPSAPVVVGSVITTNTPETITTSGRYAYVGTDTGVDVMDVSNPASPVKVTNVSIGAVGKAYSVFSAGRYVYATTPNDTTTAAYLKVIDTSTNTLVGTFNLSGGTSGNVICAGNNSPRSVYVQGRYAFVANCGNNAIDVFDVKDPTAGGAPVKTLATTGIAANVGPFALSVQGRYLYAALNTSGTTPSYIAAYDISTISSMSMVGSALTISNTGQKPSGIAISGRYLYIANLSSQNVEIFDLGGTYTQTLEVGSTETSTLQVGSDSFFAGNASISGGLQVGQSAQVSGNLGVNGQAVFANSSNSTSAFQVQNAAGTSLFAADTTNMRISIGSGGTATSQLYVAGKVPSAAAGSIANAANTNGGVYAQGRYVYVGSGTNVKVFDFSNPASPTAVATQTMGIGSSPRAMVAQGHYLYFGDGSVAGSPRLGIVDISNPAAPSLVGAASTGSNTQPSSVYVQGRYAYLTVTNTVSCGCGLRIFDVSNPAAPVSVGTTTLGDSGVYVQGRYAYAIDSTAGLKIYDVSNPASPTSVGTLAGITGYSIYVQGRYAYAFSGNNLKIIDVSNPASPATVGTVATGTTPKSVYIQGRFAYIVNNGSNTMQTFDVSDPTNPTSVGTVSTGSTPQGLYVLGRYAYEVNSSTLESFDLGGEYTQQLEAGGVEAGTLQTNGNADINGDASIQGSLQVGQTLNVQGSLATAGSITGGSINDSKAAESGAATYNEGAATAYYLSSSNSTNNTTFNTTFNITGLPSVDGTFVFISASAAKGATASTTNHTTIVQIGGSTISTVNACSSVQAGACAAVTRSFTVARINGTWTLVGEPAVTALSGAQATATTADYAEWIPYTGVKPQPGDVLRVGDSAVSAKQSGTPYDNGLMGVVSTSPYQVAGADDGHSVIIALTGRVPVKVSLENGPIVAGDLLTSSSTPGVAMKATKPGNIIGTALEAYDGTEPVAQVTVQLHNGYADPGNGQGANIQGDLGVSGDLNVSGNAHINGDLAVAGTTTTQVLAVRGSATIANLTVTGSAAFQSDISVAGHIITAGGQPIGSALVAAGQSATVAISGTDTSGTITVITGANALTAGDLAKISFSKLYGTAPHVVISPSNDAASTLRFYRGITSQDNFVLDSHDMPAASTTYQFDYFIAQ